jgi:hypothetical protein
MNSANHIIRTVSILFVVAIFTLITNDCLQAQTRPLPVAVTYRKAILSRSYVVQIRNSSNETLSLWIEAKGKTSPFVLRAGRIVEFGWAQGYHFDANNLFRIGGTRYDTREYVMPDVELSPWRITFANDAGLALSLSQSYLQGELPKFLELPVEENVSHVLEIALNQVPEIALKEGSDRIYANAILQASIFSGKVHVPITADVSFVPFYTSANGQITASQIKVENIEIKGLPKEWVNSATQIVNKILPAVFAKFVIYRLDKHQSKIAKLLNVRSVRVSDGRLEILIL